MNAGFDILGIPGQSMGKTVPQGGWGILGIPGFAFGGSAADIPGAGGGIGIGLLRRKRWRKNDLNPVELAMDDDLFIFEALET